jgi:predicted metalloprotease with PDZ domain
MMRLSTFQYVCIPIILIIIAGVGFGKGDPIRYTIRVSTSDAAGFDIEMRIPDATGTLRIAMAAHPEYDDRYFRYVEDFSAESVGRTLTFTKPEQAVWQVDGVRRGLTVRYRVRPEPTERRWRQTWKPFLTPTGGMVGDLHMLMYVVGMETRSARLTLDLPVGWNAVAGLEPTSDPRTFAGSVETLLDSPVLVGQFGEWKFTAGGVPHTVAIFSAPDEKPVDPAPIVDGIRKLAEQAIKAFGKPPYPRYAFLLENGGQADLEHRTSLNSAIRADLADLFEHVAHEYVHVWNLIDVQPRERVGLKYRFAEPTGTLWWNEGGAIFCSDLLIRRAGLAVEHRSRVARLESLITRFLSAPGYRTLPAELVSRGDSHPELLAGDGASTHLQGEVLVTMLDLRIRDATDGKRSVDDVMRLLSARYDIDRGIDNSDIERALGEVCRCEMKRFFGEHIYAATELDFDRYLGLIGMRAEIRRVPATDKEGKLSADLRIGPLSSEGGLKIRITNSDSAWARAGLRTGDKVVSANGEPIADWSTFRSLLQTLKSGDTVRLAVERGGTARDIDVTLAPFDVPSVRIVELEGASPKQIRLREAWKIGS